MNRLISLFRERNATAIGVLLAMLVTATSRQLGFWKDSETLFRQT